ncbi:MAG TPA: type I 3-dehydroquinate dehydratase [Rubrivivax sp.]|nr:type I 3-dehydroquinate dehydratase [Rubrivivax sp.]
MTQAPKLIHLHGQPIAGGALPLICTPLIARTTDALLAELAAVLPKMPDLIEWRVDFFDGIADTAMVVETARALKASAGAIPILFTRRSNREGGQRIALDEAGVVRLYEAVCEQGSIDLIDYEMCNDAHDFARLRSASRAQGIVLVASYHNFQATPDAAALVNKFAQAEQLGADVAKLAVMPQGPQDVLTLLAATHTASQTLQLPLISMSMGAYGSLSRMMGWVYGSTVTFAVGQSSSAPGQLPIDELRSALDAVRRALSGAPEGGSASLDLQAST